MGNAREVSAEELTTLLEKGGNVIIDFWAPWCAPCIAFTPTFEAAAQANPDTTFVKVNVDEESEVAATFGVRAIPTMFGLKDGKVVSSRVGSSSRAQLDKFIEELVGAPADDQDAP